MKQHFYIIGKGPVIDESEGVIKGVSLIQKGDAEGHFDKKGRQEVVDDTTLMQVFTYCREVESIKVKADHGSGVFSTIGYVDNFALTPSKVTGDFHIYESEPQRPRLFEIARKNPEHMGMSLEFEGKDEADGNKSFSRCERVLAVALVSDPAANKSLFSREEAKPTTTMDENENKDDELTVESLAKKYDELSKKFEDYVAETSKKLENEEPDGDESHEEPDGDEAVEVVATDPTKEPAGSDPEKTYSRKEVDAIANAAAEKVIKKFASQVGITKLGKPGPAPTEHAKTKHFEEFVAEKANELFKGDQVAARAHILTNFAKYPEARKAYEASRPVKHS